VFMALLVLEASPQVTLGDSQVAASIGMMLAISLLLIVCMTSLGVCLSTFARGSLQSITLLFSAWVILVLGIPKITPMMAEIIHPSETRRVISSRKAMLTKDLMTEFHNRRERLTDSLLSKEDNEHRALIEMVLRGGNIPGKYAPQVDELWREYRIRTPLELEKIEEQYRNQLQAKHTLAMILSRMSPLCCYSYSITSLAGTGVDEPKNFINNAKRYQHQISQLLYDNIIIGSNGYGWEKGFDARQVPTFPDMAYARANAQQVIGSRVFDILLLVVYTLLFYSMAFIRIVKYDVR
jgi:ABC-type transport system involved in multi-copper enzyme maturation permease subunit